MTRTRRAVTAALLAAVLAPGAAACGAGLEAQTQQVYPPSDGVLATSGDLTLLNALVVVPEAREGGGSASPTAGGESGGLGTLSMTVSNGGRSDDRLVDVQAREVGGARFEGAREVPAGGVLRIGSGSGSSSLVLEGLKAQAGSFVDLRLVFERAGAVELRAPVVPGTGAYASLTPTARPSASPSAARTATSAPSAEPTSSPTTAG